MTMILVVDDDQLMRRSLSLGLQNAGYRTETAGSGEEALAKAAWSGRSSSCWTSACLESMGSRLCARCNSLSLRLSSL